MHLDADMKKLGLWKGLCFHMNAFQIHGRSITADDIGSLMPVSNLEATPATRLDEMYLEQHLFNDRLRIKIGQLAADTEFILWRRLLILLERHLGLAVDRRRRSAERRPSLSAGDPRRTRGAQAQ